MNIDFAALLSMANHCDSPLEESVTESCASGREELSIALFGSRRSLELLNEQVTATFGGVRKVLVTPILQQVEQQRLVTADLALVGLDGTGLDPLSWAFSARAGLGNPEVVVVLCASSICTEWGLRGLGVRPVLNGPEIVPWLRQAADTFADVARGRRAQRRALQYASVPLRSGPESDDVLPGLFHAESTFREIYIRFALARTDGSRRKAADLARVPYRTFCQMMSALGIKLADTEG